MADMTVTGDARPGTSRTGPTPLASICRRNTVSHTNSQYTMPMAGLLTKAKMPLSGAWSDGRSRFLVSLRNNLDNSKIMMRDSVEWTQTGCDRRDPGVTDYVRGS